MTFLHYKFCSFFRPLRRKSSGIYWKRPKNFFLRHQHERRNLPHPLRLSNPPWMSRSKNQSLPAKKVQTVRKSLKVPAKRVHLPKINRLVFTTSHQRGGHSAKNSCTCPLVCVLNTISDYSIIFL